MAGDFLFSKKFKISHNFSKWQPNEILIANS